MAETPSRQGYPCVLVAFAQLVDFATCAFVAAGIPPEDAQKAAQALVDADLHGIHTHGVRNLPGYVRAVREGRVNPRPRVAVVGGTAVVKVMTGDHGLGHVVAHAGMEAAIEVAQQYGAGMVFMRESNHYGASGYWARLALRHGMVGFAVTNAGPSIAPWGGAQPLLGNNPPAWAIPASATDDEGEADPIFLDMALSVVASGRLALHQGRGEPIPLGWALDKDGNPTTDPRARALGGSLLPIAEYKGYGLTLVYGLLTSLLAGGAFDSDQDRPDPPHPRGRCHWFMALDVRQIVPLDEFTARVRAIAERMRSSRLRPGFQRIYLPGEIEREKARRYRVEGIPLERFILADLRRLSETLGIPYDLPA